MSHTMQFRDIVFRHNPQTISITQTAGTAHHFCPGKGELVQQLGSKSRTVKCQGSFFGNSFQEAAAQLDGLCRAARVQQPGTLFLPGVAPFPAHLQQLLYEYVDDGKIIPYTLVFQEAEVKP